MSDIYEALLERALLAEAVIDHNVSMAVAWAWDTGRNNAVTCFWCGLNLGRSEGVIRQHTADCEKRPMMPTAAATRIANLEAELAASHLAAQRMAVEAARDEREACAELIENDLHGNERLAAAIRARGDK